MTDDEFKSHVIKKLDLVLFWLRIANLETARNHFKNLLDSSQKIQAYNMTDGNNTIEDIMKATGIKSKGTISGWWTEWFTQGIVTESQVYAGRKEKTIELSNLGM